MRRCCVHKTCSFSRRNMSGRQQRKLAARKQRMFVCRTFKCFSYARDHRHMLISAIAYLPPATKLGQGYIFTGVCDSVRRACMVVGACVVVGGMCDGRGACMGYDEIRSMSGAVRILLECILVVDVIVIFATT